MYSDDSVLIILFFLLYLCPFQNIVDGCETSPLGTNRPSGSTIRRSPGILIGGNSLRSPPTSSPPTTTLLQNILQQSRNGTNGSNGSPNGTALHGGPNQGPNANGTTNTSPLPPSPADSGVSDVDSHYSSNDEQQQLSQYSYFYSQAHRSTCKYLLNVNACLFTCTFTLCFLLTLNDERRKQREVNSDKERMNSSFLPSFFICHPENGKLCLLLKVCLADTHTHTHTFISTLLLSLTHV